jgi:hypothetical protein
MSCWTPATVSPWEALVALTEAVPLTGQVAIEPTASGMESFSYDLRVRAKQGESRHGHHSHPWRWDPGYGLPGCLLGDLSEDERRFEDACAPLAFDTHRGSRPRLGGIADKDRGPARPAAAPRPLT